MTNQSFLTNQQLITVLTSTNIVAVCAAIVRKHGSEIDVESKLWEGQYVLICSAVGQSLKI